MKTLDEVKAYLSSRIDQLTEAMDSVAFGEFWKRSFTEKLAYTHCLVLLNGLDVKGVPGNAGCGHDCHHQEPYGFVPEADCPVHDAAKNPEKTIG